MLRVWLFTSVVFAFVVASNPAPGQEKQPPSPSGRMKSMEKTDGMGGMMKGKSK